MDFFCLQEPKPRKDDKSVKAVKQSKAPISKGSKGQEKKSSIPSTSKSGGASSSAASKQYVPSKSDSRYYKEDGAKRHGAWTRGKGGGKWVAIPLATMEGRMKREAAKKATLEQRKETGERSLKEKSISETLDELEEAGSGSDGEVAERPQWTPIQDRDHGEESASDEVCHLFPLRAWSFERPARPEQSPMFSL